eukprot:scaffold35035_cov71-Phaeocystis_antarctica.AAC.2
MSINTEFDFWPEERLAALVSCLAKREGKPLPPKAGGRARSPPECARRPRTLWLWVERSLLSTWTMPLRRRGRLHLLGRRRAAVRPAATKKAINFKRKKKAVELHGLIVSRRTHLLEDQLGRADAGSWQIADGSTVATAADHRTFVGNYRVRFVVELYTAGPPTVRFSRRAPTW